MATVQVMSSPLGARLGCMDSSPSRTNLDLPDAFDTSFGSQMSISSNPIGDEFNNSLNNDFQHHQRGSSYKDQNTLTVHSPLAPALGTLLNSKSPGLAAKLASTSNFQFHRHPIDISPSPSFSNGVNVNRPRSSTISSQSKSRRDGTATSRRGQGYSESHLPDTGFGSNSNLSIADVSMASISNEGGGGNHSSGNGGVGLSAMITNSQEFRESASSSINSNTSSNNSGSHPSSSSPPRKSKSKSRSNSNSSSSGNGRQSVGRNRSSSASLEKSRHHDNHNQNSRGGGGSQECPPSAGSTLGRLFGMELSLNDNDDLEEDDENDGLGFEPTLKKRPSSLPLGGGSNPSRPSILGSGILSASSNARSRPTLMQSFTSKPALGGVDRTVRKQASVDSISPNFSSSSYGRPARSRHSSVESVFDAPSQGSHPDLLTRASLGYVPSAHDTIIESPSPAALERKEGLSDYFFDPQSPEHQAPPSQPSRPVSRATSGKRSNSPPNAAAVPRRPGPRPSLGIRKLEKAHSSVVLPTRSALNNGGGSTSSSGSGTTRTLGKRSNPYGSGSRNSGSGSGSSSRQSGGATSASQGLLGSGKGNADPIKRLTAPAPRRTQSASDYSATLNSLMHTNNNENRSSNLADVSMASSAADSSMDQSPVRKRTMIGNDYPNGFDYGSPVNSSTRGKMFSRPSMLRTSSKDDASPLGYGTGIKRSNSRQNNSGHGEDDSMVGVSINNSPGPIGGGIPSSPFMPGFGASEREGKVLPCFSVSNDGLMRVSTNTVADLLEGKFDQDIGSYQIIDCRFGYEYQGGHIPGAINLNTLEKVKNHFLVPNQGLHYPNLDLPPRSQSGKVDRNGNLKKTVLVFHCEFSAKRAPSMALALRQADRSLNSDYPNCHFPEIYILKGGYCEFFKDFKGKCKPEQYITMDDERFQTKCSNELGAFRKQFERHRSFTYGDTKNNAISNPLLQHGIGGGSKRRNANLTMTKEDERDVSNSSNSHVEDSPSMAVVGRKTNSLQSGNSNTLGSNFTVNSSSRPSLNSRGFTLGPKISESNSFNSISQSGSNVSMTNGEGGRGGLQDVSFSSSNGDSSFEGLGGPGDYSPCAVASRRPSLMLPPSSNNGNSGRLVMGNNGQQPPQLGRLKLQRAGTTPNFQP